MASVEEIGQRCLQRLAVNFKNPNCFTFLERTYFPNDVLAWADLDPQRGKIMLGGQTSYGQKVEFRRDGREFCLSSLGAFIPGFLGLEKPWLSCCFKEDGKICIVLF